MKATRLFVALALSSASLAFAAPPVYMTVDNSNSTLMNGETAKGLWKQNLRAKMFKLYPEKKWGFVSEVEGGFDDARVCVVTARAMMLPRSGKALLYRPAKTATAYGSQSGATEEQCRALGKAKLNEAIVAVNSALMAP